MSTQISPFAGKPAPSELVGRYPAPDHGVLQRAPRSRGRRAARRVRHVRAPRLSFEASFNESHVLAITQAICRYRKQQGINGPLFLGIDTHALSAPAFASALEVLAANGVDVMIAERRRIHADAGDFPRHPVLQPRAHERPGRRHRDHAVAQSAGQRRLQVQPAERRARRIRTITGWIEAEANQLLADEARRRATRSRSPRRAARRPRTRTIISTPTSPTSATSSTWTRFAARSCAWASIRSAARACTTGRRSPSITGWISRW